MLGAIVLDILVGIPHWLSYKGKIIRDGKILIKYGLFAVKGREMDKYYKNNRQNYAKIKSDLIGECSKK